MLAVNQALNLKDLLYIFIFLPLWIDVFRCHGEKLWAN
jgi:hypothetical protein